MFELDNVSKHFGNTVALAPTTLMILKSKTTILIGPGGSWKSTLLRLLIGLLAPDHGVVRYQGQPINKNNVGARRRKVGVVVQEGGLFPHMTAKDNVSLMASHLGWAALVS